MPPPLVEFSAVSKGYDGKNVLPGLDLEVHEGEFLTLLGPSGCGKSTALRLLAGFESPDGGEIRLEGAVINPLPPEQRPINTVFQSYALFPHMTVEENISFGLRMKRLPSSEIRQRVSEALEMVRLPELARRKPGQLSGGQQQRIALARALVNRPRVLLLDESLSALDFGLRKAMQTELKVLQRFVGLTFIFVTHDQEEALSMSDRVAVMRDGVIQQIGPPRDIYETPANAFVARFVGESNLLEGVITRRLDDGRADIAIENRIFPLSAPLCLSPGERVVVLLRPQDLQMEIVGPKQPGEGRLTGVIKDRTYKGMTLDTLIRLDSGTVLRASEFFDGDDAALTPGQRVAVGWTPNSPSVLPADAPF
ncbi:MAG: spermidine/putrescine ABC transporter ATP-binding protein PotA [Methylococcaceae bacterium]|nr:spermidine/putrescine ABC transporter ATP-binding protein PotA [Methylococcaceae bacterium]